MTIVDLILSVLQNSSCSSVSALIQNNNLRHTSGRGVAATPLRSGCAGHAALTCIRYRRPPCRRFSALLVKRRSNAGQAPVKRRSSAGQTPVKRRSSAGRPRLHCSHTRHNTSPVALWLRSGAVLLPREGLTRPGARLPRPFPQGGIVHSMNRSQCPAPPFPPSNRPPSPPTTTD